MRFCNLPHLVFVLMFVIVTFGAGTPTPREQQSEAKTQPAEVSSEHDFDFLMGSWSVQHHRLKYRLTRRNEMENLLRHMPNMASTGRTGRCGR